MQIKEKIFVAKDFTDAPGARDIADGNKSGEEFYNNILKPKFVSACENNGQLFINLDDSWGYASSFISGAFGRLSKEFSGSMGVKSILSHISFKSDDDPSLIDDIIREITDPNQRP